MENSAWRAAGEIIDRHVTIVQTHSQDVRIAGMDVNTEDTRAGCADILGVGGVLQRKQTEIASPTGFVKIVRSVAHSEEIPVSRIPLQVCDLQSVRFVVKTLLFVRILIFKCPERQQSSLPVLVLIRWVFIEPVVPRKLSKPYYSFLEQIIAEINLRIEVQHSLDYLG